MERNQALSLVRSILPVIGVRRSLKDGFPLFLLSSLALSALGPQSVTAASVTWDANAATAGQVDGAGTGAWLADNQWWNGTSNVTWNNAAPDDAVFGVGGTGGKVQIRNAVSAGSLTFNSFSGTYLLERVLDSDSLTVNNGITLNTGSGDVTLNVAMTLGNNQIWSNSSSGVLTVSGTIAGAKSIEKTGAGTLVLNASNTFSGGFTLSAGTLKVNNVANNLGTGTLSLNGGTLASTSVTARTVTNIVTLDADSQVGDAGSGAITFNGSTFTVNGNRQLTVANQGAVIAGGVTLNGRLTVNGSGAGTISGIIANGSSSYGITKLGAGTLTLAGTNTYSGSTIISDGQVWAGSEKALGASSVVLDGGASSAGTLDLRGNNLTINGLFGSDGAVLGKITDTAAAGTRTLTVGNGDATASFAGQIANSAANKIIALTKVGTGIQTLSGSNSYSGVTTISAGGLQFAKQVALYRGTSSNWTATSIVVESGATAAFNVGGAGEFTAANIDTLKALGTASGGFKNGAILGLDTTNAAGGVFSYSSIIANTNGGNNVLSLTKLGTNTLILNAANTYTGLTTVAGGILQAGVNNAIGSGNVTVSGGTFDINGKTDTIGALALGGAGGAGTFVGTGGGALTAASVTVSGTGNRIDSGTVAGNTTVTSGGALTVAAAGTIVGTASVNGALTVHGTISGLTTVNSGGRVGGSGAFSAVNIGDGGTLAPGGATKAQTGDLSFDAGSSYGVAFEGSATVDGPRKTTAGVDYDQTNVTGSITLGENVHLVLSLGTPLVDGGAYTAVNPIDITQTNVALANYFIMINDSADVVSGRFFDVSFDGGASFTLIDYSSGNRFGGMNGLGTFIFNGQEYAISYTGNYDTNSTMGGNDIVLTAVPESSVLFLTGLGVGLLVWGNHRRRKAA